MSLASTDIPARARRASLPYVPLWLGISVAVYVAMFAAGNGLLGDSDMFWQIATGRSILEHHTFPQTDVFSFTKYGEAWISSSWLAQVLYAVALNVAGWAGVVALASAAIALTFALTTKRLNQYLSAPQATIVALVILMLITPHLLARPHILAMPIMVAWVIGLLDASDHKRRPSLWLLPLITLWTNLHGSFVLGLVLIAAFACDAAWNANAAERRRLATQWVIFAAAAVGACCVTPYGWNSLLAAQKILSLGQLLVVISEWQAANFSHFGIFEGAILALIGGALIKGVRLSPPRILIILGIVHMALSHVRNIEVFALLLPLLVVRPLTSQFPALMKSSSDDMPRRVWPVLAASLFVCAGASGAIAAHLSFRPDPTQTPQAAVDLLKTRNVRHVLNDPMFGGYLISRQVPVFIDGRAELYGEQFGMTLHRSLQLTNVDTFLNLVRDNDIDATLLPPDTPAVSLLDHLENWQRIYADKTAVVHVRLNNSASVPRAIR